jgi:hypothetical protein
MKRWKEPASKSQAAWNPDTSQTAPFSEMPHIEPRIMVEAEMIRIVEWM